MYKTIVLAAVAGVLLSSGASAAELRFTVNWGVDDPGVVETFDVNTSIPGTPSAASTGFYGSSQDEDFVITNDNLGNTVFQAGSSGDNYYFATGVSDSAAFFNCCTYTVYTTATFYNGVSPYLQAYVGETAVGNDETTISVSAIPEPAAWTLMLVGVGAVGASFRSRRSLVGIAI